VLRPMSPRSLLTVSCVVLELAQPGVQFRADLPFAGCAKGRPGIKASHRNGSCGVWYPKCV